MRYGRRELAIAGICAAGTLTVGLVLSLPRTTHAEEIADSDRRGDYEEEGMKFGDVVVRGKLVPAAGAPGGWTLLRTIENQSDEPATCVLEERVMRQETMVNARVGPPARAVLLRNQTFSLGPREKRSVGVHLPASLASQIAMAHRERAMIERAHEQLVMTGHPNKLAQRTFMTFDVEYLTPLPPGATAEVPVDNGVRPASMAMP
jgi:hypothetical protein